MSMDAILVIDRMTGTIVRLRNEEPVKLRVCRGCYRVHLTQSACAAAA
jgi:hypothetical protein